MQQCTRQQFLYYGCALPLSPSSRSLSLTFPLSPPVFPVVLEPLECQASLQALAEVLSMVKRYRRNQRMEDGDFAAQAKAADARRTQASVLQLAAKAMLAMPEKSKAGMHDHSVG